MREQISAIEWQKLVVEKSPELQWQATAVIGLFIAGFGGVYLLSADKTLNTVFVKDRTDAVLARFPLTLPIRNAIQVEIRRERRERETVRNARAQDAFDRLKKWENKRGSD